jgi:maleate isomerase
MSYGYGSRARVGYTSPPAATEVFPYEFYLAAPDGVTLVVTSLAIVEKNKEEVDRSYEISLAAAEAQARAGINVLVLGGVPINTSRGFENVGSLIDETREKIGVPVTTSLNSQMAGLKAVGAKKVAVVHPFHADDQGPTDLFPQRLSRAGFEYVGCAGAGYDAYNLGSIPVGTALELGRQVMREHPEADSILVSCPHWPVNTSIDAMERELGVNVVSSSSSIIWNALRMCGVDDRIDGFGRLLREF